MATIDKDSVFNAYNDVRDDNTETAWAVFKYDGNNIIHDSSGTDYSEFLSNFTDEERVFGFVRIMTGDELSKRAKFALITWIGSSVSPLKKAKVSTDKALVKDVVQNFAKELLTSDIRDLEEKNVREEVQKAGGANYGTGER
ncbi:coactosin-like protein [Ptychodera flava]|uniref:coactosin-like protein n=1 Tax=Ptychodera flava TaxID=63121 RepID=UPI00396A4529